MPHLHTQPHGHDVTTSAWILRRFPGPEGGQWKALVHRHRKMGLWIQPGGHVEHTENPWQALVHELHEETGYLIGQLSVLQPWERIPDGVHDVMHPTPVLMNTHSPYRGHFHSDIVLAMTTDEDPAGPPRPGESTELAWVSPEEFAALPDAEPDAVAIMTMIVERVADSWVQVPAVDWSLADAPVEPMTSRSAAEATAPDPLDEREEEPLQGGARDAASGGASDVRDGAPDGPERTA